MYKKRKKKEGKTFKKQGTYKTNKIIKIIKNNIKKQITPQNKKINIFYLAYFLQQKIKLKQIIKLKKE